METEFFFYKNHFRINPFGLRIDQLIVFLESLKSKHDDRFEISEARFIPADLLFIQLMNNKQDGNTTIGGSFSIKETKGNVKVFLNKIKSLKNHSDSLFSIIPVENLIGQGGIYINNLNFYHVIEPPELQKLLDRKSSIDYKVSEINRNINRGLDEIESLEIDKKEIENKLKTIKIK